MAGRLVGTVFFGIFLAAGILFVGLIAREAWRTGETYTWPERSCEIVHSGVVRGNGESPYRPEVSFRSVDAGPTVSGSQIQRRELSYGSYGDAAERVAPYPVGMTVTCSVSTAGETVLEPGPPWVALWLLMPLVFVAVGGGGIFAMWWPWKSDRTDRFGRPMPKELGGGAKQRVGARVMLAFGLLFGGAGGVMLWFFAVLPFAHVLAARSWEQASCTVEHSSVVAHRSDDGTTYSVDILYRWERGRGVERSSRYSFFSGSTSGYDGKAEIVRAHPEGAEVACWLNPRRSNEAVLERDLTPHAFLALIPLVFLAAAGAMIRASRRQMTGRAKIESVAYADQAPFAPDDPIIEVLPEFELEPGPVTLPTQSSRWGRVLGITFAAIFWNGIVSVFANQVWQGWSRGSPDWFLSLFLVPFVLAGIGMLLGIVYSLLALANPRPELVISSRTPRLGDAVELQWRFSGRSDRLDRVRIALKGREEATYQVGTNTRTASDDFFEHVLVDAPPHAGFAGGNLRIEIPAGSMHSFESGHNKILWQLELTGEIHRWPDVCEVYPLVVLPRPAGDHKPEER